MFQNETTKLNNYLKINFSLEYYLKSMYNYFNFKIKLKKTKHMKIILKSKVYNIAYYF